MTKKHCLPFSHSCLVVLALLAIDTGTMRAEVAKQESSLVTVEVNIDPDTVVRTNGRHFMGVNQRFPDRGGYIFDDAAGELEAPAWNAIKEAAPGLIRFPAGNWCYGYHFNLAVDGIKHKINGSDTTAKEHDQDFRPQHFLRMINKLNKQGVQVTPLIHGGAQHTSPEEAAAFVAFMIGKKTDTTVIGTDSLNRKINLPGFANTSWGTVQYWANKRESTAGAGSRFTGTLYYQFGNEEYLKGCDNCEGLSHVIDMKSPPTYGGPPKHVRAMSITDSTVAKAGQYTPRFVETYNKIRDIWPAASDVAVGPIIYTAISRPHGGEDKRAGTDDGWNAELFKYLSSKGTVPEFLTLHTYQYDKRGWQIDSVDKKRHNVLASDSQLDDLLAEIKKLAPTQSLKEIPIYITEWNITAYNRCKSQTKCRKVHFWPSSLLHALHIVNWTSSGMYMDDLGGFAYWLLAKESKNLNAKGGGFTVLASSPNSTKVFKNSPFYAYKLLGMMHNTVVARTNPTNVDWKPWSAEWRKKPYASSYWSVEKVPFVSAAATLSDDRKELAVLLINKNTVDNYRVKLNLGSFTPAEGYTKYVLNSTVLDEGHKDIYDRNLYSSSVDGGVEEQTEVEILETNHSAGATQSMTVNIPSHSATLLKFTR